MSTLFYKGKGEHSVNQLETIVENQKFRLEIENNINQVYKGYIMLIEQHTEEDYISEKIKELNKEIEKLINMRGLDENNK